MKEIIKMLVVLTIICTVCGFLLAMVKSKTEARIEEQVLLNVQGPAVEDVLSDATNKKDLIKDRQRVKVGGKEMVVFVGKKDGVPWAIAYETFGKGFKDDIGVIVGFSLTDEKLIGIGITTLKETAGLGARVRESSFTDGFKGKALTDTFKVRADDGIIDAISGATISSRAVCTAVREAVKISGDVKGKIKE